MITASIEDVQTSYDPFSNEPEYVDVNRLFVTSLPLRAGWRIVDLACGTGTLSELLRSECQLRNLLGIDISRVSLSIARAKLAAGAAESWPWFVQASANNLPLADQIADAVVVGNAIQLFDAKPAVIRELRRVLRPGGLLGFNTSFYAGTYAEGTDRFYLRWMEEAVAFIQRKDAELRAQGHEGIRRKKGQARLAFTQPWLSCDEYRRLLEDNGFAVGSIVERTVDLPPRSFEAIGAYAGLAGVLLSGFPIHLACEALAASARPALESVGLAVVPRKWIEFTAHRK